MTGKQRAKLRGMANTIETILYIGKDGITENTVRETYDALEARELIKVNVLKNCEEELGDCAEKLGSRTHSEVVMVIGRRFVLYRRAEEPVIELPR